MDNPRLVHVNGNPMGNVPWDGMGINCYGMGIGQINMSPGQPWKYTYNYCTFTLKYHYYENT